MISMTTYYAIPVHRIPSVEHAQVFDAARGLAGFAGDSWD